MIPDTVSYSQGCVSLLDQTKLPHMVEQLECRDMATLIDGIVRLVVRGAPAIGVAGAYGCVLACELRVAEGLAGDGLRAALRKDFDALSASRPTAVNLAWAVGQMRELLEAADSTTMPGLGDALLVLATRLHDEDRTMCRQMGEHGATLLADRCRVLTHCNTGALATTGIGTALGVVIAAHEAGKMVEVFADETRPLLQGARLTAWECQQRGIPVTVLCDGAAGWALKTQQIDAVLIGSDRIAANGDVANKIGSYPLAVMAQRHGVPFYVVAPYSTLDMSLASGEEIPIELRDPSEVHHALGTRLAPPGVGGFNPAFDVTPAELVTAIVTECGIFRHPFTKSLAKGYEPTD